MKFPYGIHDFKKIVTEEYFYCDRTDRIPLLEEMTSVIFVRPPGFGKSLLLSMLANYYDIALADRFQEIFGNLLIGQNPTELHNTYYILQFDFSCVDPNGKSIDEVKKALYDHINERIEAFRLYYQNYSLREIKIDTDNALNSLSSLLLAVRMAPHPIYLLVNGYDNFIIRFIMGKEKNDYEPFDYGHRLLKTFFKIVKSETCMSVIDQTFITGILPVSLSDVSSGYNIAQNISLTRQFNDLCGFTEKEIADILKNMADKCEIKKDQLQKGLDMMKEYYAGYSFSYSFSSSSSQERIYNPGFATYFLEYFHTNYQFPDKMLDCKPERDQLNMAYIFSTEAGKKILSDLVTDDNAITINNLKTIFSIERIFDERSKTLDLMASLLYYMGVLTIAEEVNPLHFGLKIPNHLSQEFYVNHTR